MVYEWLQPEWSRLLEQYKNNTLSHAYLINGVQGIGKNEFARAVSAYVLCEVTDGSQHHPCGLCKACKLVSAQTHPDLKILQPEEGSSVLKVDAIRSMVEFFEHSSMQAGKKVAIIEPAEALNINAANALLKTLEEPSGDSLILLVSHNLGQLLPTIRSRCQVLDMSTPPIDQAQKWLLQSDTSISQKEVENSLKLANGAPLKAKAFIEADAYKEYCNMLDELAAFLKKELLVTKLADRWSDDISILRLQWVVQWVELLMHLKLESGSANPLYKEKMFDHLAKKANVEQINEVYRHVLAQLKLLFGTSNPNKNMLFESVLLRLSGLMN